MSIVGPGDRVGLIGNGGHARSVRATLARIGAVAAPLHSAEYSHVAIGDNARRERLAAERPERSECPPIIDPTAVVSGCSLHEGTFIGARAYIGPGVPVCLGAIINTGAIVEHDAYVGEWAFVAPGAVLLGAAIVGRSAMIGAGAVIFPGVVVEDRAVVGAGAVVRSRVLAGETWVGVPARRAR